jgi:alanyl-tRNA synthetase
VRATVDADTRAATSRNHTATHLLHRALKEVLGDHVTQQGSYVGPDRLRFDFAHPSGLTADDIVRVEEIVSRRVFANAPVRTTLEELSAAKSRGVTALFGEKYEERVRVVDVGGWSIELCGGIHVRAAGDIGTFLILSERAVSAGVRRIEAVTGEAALEELQRTRRILRESAVALKTKPEELVARIGALQEKLKEAGKKMRQGASGDIAAAFESVKSSLATRGGILTGVVDLPDLDGKDLDELAGRVASLSDALAVVLIGREGGRVPFQVLSTGAAQARGLRAGPFAKSLGAQLRGGGGGRADRAQGQGTDSSRIEGALKWAEESLDAALNG